MHGNDTAGQIAILDAFETSVLYHAGKCRLVGKLADAFNEVSVRLTIACDNLADGRDHAEGVGFIDLFQPRDSNR